MKKRNEPTIYDTWKKLPRNYSWHEPTGRRGSSGGGGGSIVNAIFLAVIIAIIFFSISNV